MNSNNTNYSMLGSPDDRKNRGEQYYKELAELNEAKKELNKKTKSNRKLTNKGKKFINRSLATTGAIMLLAKGTGYAIAQYNYQNDIDKHNAEISITELPNDITLSEKERKEGAEYLIAVSELSKNDSWDKEEDYERIVLDYTMSGKAYNMMKKVMVAKLDSAKKYGDIEEYKDNEKTEIKYINNVEEQGFRISGVEQSFYSVNGFDILAENIPENLKQLTEDILDYDGKWDNREDCLKDGIEIGTHLETVIGENYILKDSKIERINDEDYKKCKEKYVEKQNKKEEETRDRIWNEYGIAAEEMKHRVEDIEK